MEITSDHVGIAFSLFGIAILTIIDFFNKVYPFPLWKFILVIISATTIGYYLAEITKELT